MRYYAIVIDGQVKYSSLASGGISGDTSNPGALNVEMDIPVVPFATPMGGAKVVVWGIGLADIGQAANLVGKDIQIFGGMAKGLPLANPAQAGLLAQGFIFQPFGNWIGTEQTLDLIIMPGAGPNGTGTAAGPRNIVLNWKKGTTLAAALKTTLSTAFQGFQQSINISDNLVRQADDVGYFQTVQQLALYVRQASKSIVKDEKYAGVDLVLVGKTFTAYDGTAAQSGTVKQIAFQDLIGQPTWIEAPLIQWKTAMRADIAVGDTVKLPPSQITNTQQAQSSLVNQQLNFQGNFTVSLVRHLGNFRQPDAASWVTVFEGYPAASA